MEIFQKIGWARLSLIYPTSVLFGAGMGLLFAQDLVFQLMHSSGSYSPTMVQMTGMFMVVLSAFVGQTLRHGWSEMVVWTLGLHLFMAVCLIGFFLETQDPFFVFILLILLVGIVLTVLGLIIDHSYPHPTWKE